MEVGKNSQLLNISDQRDDVSKTCTINTTTQEILKWDSEARVSFAAPHCLRASEFFRFYIAVRDHKHSCTPGSSLASMRSDVPTHGSCKICRNVHKKKTHRSRKFLLSASSSFTLLLLGNRWHKYLNSRLIRNARLGSDCIFVLPNLSHSCTTSKAANRESVRSAH